MSSLPWADPLRVTTDIGKGVAYRNAILRGIVVGLVVMVAVSLSMSRRPFPIFWIVSGTGVYVATEVAFTAWRRHRA